MNIEFYTQSFPPMRFIGAELYDLAIVKKLKSEGHTVSVRATNIDKQWEHDGIKVNHEPEENPDIVFTHLDLTAKAYLRAKMTGAKLFAIGHNTEDGTISAGQFGKYDGIIFNSESMKKEFGKTASENIVVFPPAPKPGTRGKKIKQDIISVNQAAAKGGVIFANVANELPNEKFVGVLGGWGKQYITELPNLRYIEQSSKSVTQALSGAKAFIVASTKESWGMAASEAIAAGVPVIYFEHLTGVAENVEDAGVAVKAGAFMELVRAVTGELPSRAKCIEQAKKNKARHEESLDNLMKFIGVK